MYNRFTEEQVATASMIEELCRQAKELGIQEERMRQENQEADLKRKQVLAMRENLEQTMVKYMAEYPHSGEKKLQRARMDLDDSVFEVDIDKQIELLQSARNKLKYVI